MLLRGLAAPRPLLGQLLSRPTLSMPNRSSLRTPLTAPVSVRPFHSQLSSQGRPRAPPSPASNSMVLPLRRMSWISDKLKKLGLADPLHRYDPTPELRQHWEALRNTKDEIAMARELMWIVRYENTDLWQMLLTLNAPKLLRRLISHPSQFITRLAFYLLMEIEYNGILEEDPEEMKDWVDDLPQLEDAVRDTRIQALVGGLHKLMMDEVEDREEGDEGTDPDDTFFPLFIEIFLHRLPKQEVEKLLNDLRTSQVEIAEDAWADDERLIDRLTLILNERGLLGFMALVLGVDAVSLKLVEPALQSGQVTAPRTAGSKGRGMDSADASELQDSRGSSRSS